MSISKILYQTLCVFSQMKDRKHTELKFSFCCQDHAPGWDLGVLGGVKILPWGFAMAPPSTARSSLNLEPDSQVKSQICAILKYEGTIVTVNKVPVQQQHGSIDCGLFAIANIVALCFGYEPNKIPVQSRQNEKSPDFMPRSRAVFYVPL